ncbi:MAG: Rpn family recombination-promoting nuclease/putative transposase, partial [Blastocatellia bacterium]
MKRKQKTNAHDKFFKAVFGRPAVAADFLRRYLPGSIVELLDLTQIELEKDSFIDARLRQHFSDLLYRVGLAGGGEAYLYFLLEHKSQPDQWVALQLLRYLAQAWERLRRKGVEKLPLIIPVVFYHGSARWDVSEQFHALLDVDPKTVELLDYVPGFKYYLCDLSRYSDEELEGGRRSGRLASVAQAHLRRRPRPAIERRLPPGNGTIVGDGGEREPGNDGRICGSIRT